MSKINVKAKRDPGFWRAGLHFTREGRELDTSELSEAQIQAIQEEPNLVVTEVGETDEAREKREKAEAVAAKKANDAALGREKAAIKSADGKTAWEAATAAARAAAPELDDAAWGQLPASDRVSRIEAVLPAKAG